MAEAVSKPVITVTTMFQVSEAEARALVAFAGSDKNWVRSVCSKLGDHGQDLLLFLDTVRTAVTPAIERIDRARALLSADDKANGC